ncbi:hypothetical protein D9M71_709550 [compost metagenome]
MAVGLLQYVEGHALAGELAEQFGQVLLVADVARAGRVPEMHQADRAGAGDGVRQLQAIAGKQRRLVVEGTQVATLEAVVRPPQARGAQCGDKQAEQGAGGRREHGDGFPENVA